MISGSGRFSALLGLYQKNCDSTGSLAACSPLERHIAPIAVAEIMRFCAAELALARCDETFDLSRIARDDEGYLRDPGDWSFDAARALADEAGLVMTGEHWQIVEFIRDSYEATQVVPEARKLLRWMQTSLGPERATRRYLYSLFPTGYGQTACKIAGMRKPLKLMLDV